MIVIRSFGDEGSVGVCYDDPRFLYVKLFGNLFNLLGKWLPVLRFGVAEVLEGSLATMVSMMWRRSLGVGLDNTRYHFCFWEAAVLLDFGAWALIVEC